MPRPKAASLRTWGRRASSRAGWPRTRKVRRGYIGEKYQVLVDAMYGGRTDQFIETAVKFEDGRTGSVSATLKILDAKTFAAIGGKAA